jgi:hypothetical protein
LKYLCLVYAEEKRIAALSDSEWDALEAIQVAGRIPGACLGSIEVRAIRAHDPREPWARQG